MFIFGLDIGRNTALTVMEINDNLDIVSIENYFLDMNTISGSDIKKKKALYDMVKNLVIKYEPTVLAIESPYMGSFPKSFGLLSEFMDAIELAAFGEEENIVQYRVSPKEGKRIFNAKSDDKEDMLIALENIHELDIHIKFELNEHEVDSVAMCYWVVQRYRREPGLFIIDKYK